MYLLLAPVKILAFLLTYGMHLILFKVDCGDGVQSFGKRRRRRDAPHDLLTSEKLIFDPNLGQEVIYYSTPLKKQIRVASGTKVDEFRDTDLATAGNGGNYCQSSDVLTLPDLAQHVLLL